MQLCDLPALRVLLCYKQFGYANTSHIGLGLASMNIAKTLHHDLGIDVEVLALQDELDLGRHLAADTAPKPYTHVVIAAPWVSTGTLSSVCGAYPRIQFAVVCHSNVGFLQADARGIELIREDLGLQTGALNFTAAANTERLTEFIEQAYGDTVALLPNLYWMDHLDRAPRPGWGETGGTLKIGIFGATRTLKNILSAVGACLIIAKDLKAETEIWVSSGQDEGSGVLDSVRALTADVPSVTLKMAPWVSWPQFRKVVGSMHLLMQPSYTEAFNLVTADGVHEGVPSVVSSAITWAPPEWKADVDDVRDIARAGVALIYDPAAPARGTRALRCHNKMGVGLWRAYLTTRGGVFDPLAL